MSSDKYFTPSIEDIRVGYECEIDPTGTWTNQTVALGNLRHFVGMIEKGVGVRVPYLTKEQIEAEGWKTFDIGLSHYLKASKDCLFKEGFQGKNWDYSVPVEINVDYDKNTRIMEIYRDCIDAYIMFKGECKDINTFRYICKLLGI